jgi:hypothetical protein
LEQPAQLLCALVSSWHFQQRAVLPPETEPLPGDPSMERAPTFFRNNYQETRRVFLGLPSDDEEDATMVEAESIVDI